MNNPVNSSKVQFIGGIVIVLAAVILGLTKFKLPAKTVNLNYPVQNTSTTNQNVSTTNTQSTMTYTFPGKLPADQIDNKQARIKTNKGEIVFSLDSAQAPLAVSNFVYLANLGYYNGLTWHRVVADFVIQGGDPLGTGTGGPGYKFPDEPVTSPYVEGTVAMANSGPNTNGSQFFITNADDTQKLENKYSIFGHVTSGLDVVKSIVQGDTMDMVTIEPAS